MQRSKKLKGKAYSNSNPTNSYKIKSLVDNSFNNSLSQFMYEPLPDT